jgi:hypothetical protein
MWYGHPGRSSYGAELEARKNGLEARTTLAVGSNADSTQGRLVHFKLAKMEIPYEKDH